MHRESVFLGVIIGTPISTLAVYYLEIGSIGSMIGTQTALALICVWLAIRKANTKETEN